MRNFFQNEKIRDGAKRYGKLLTRVALVVLAWLLIIHLRGVIIIYFMPFIMAFIMATALDPLVTKLQKRWNLSRRILSVMLAVLGVLTLVGILGAFIFTLVRELIELGKNVDVMIAYFENSLNSFTDNLNWMLNFLPGDTELMIEGLVDSFLIMLQDQTLLLTDNVISQTVPITTRVGSGVISFFIFVIATYFITVDYPHFSAKIQGFMGHRLYSGYHILKNAALSAAGKYLRAQLMMSFIVFLFSLVCLLVLQQSYALILALLLGIVDILPFLGTAVILLPWAIFTFLGGQTAKAAFLIIMSVVAFMMRRLLEPKLVSSGSGISPLTALFAIYVGMRLGGIIGMITAPIAAIILVSIYKAGMFDGWIDDINAVIDFHRKY